MSKEINNNKNNNKEIKKSIITIVSIMFLLAKKQSFHSIL